MQNASFAVTHDFGSALQSMLRQSCCMTKPTPRNRTLSHLSAPSSAAERRWALSCCRLKDPAAGGPHWQPRSCLLEHGLSNARGRRGPSIEIDTRTLAGISPPPEGFMCPLSRCLLTEPVTLRNTGVTIQRTSAQNWLRTCEFLFSCLSCGGIASSFIAPDTACQGQAGRHVSPEQ